MTAKDETQAERDRCKAIAESPSGQRLRNSRVLSTVTFDLGLDAESAITVLDAVCEDFERRDREVDDAADPSAMWKEVTSHLKGE